MAAGKDGKTVDLCFLATVPAVKDHIDMGDPELGPGQWPVFGHDVPAIHQRLRNNLSQFAHVDIDPRDSSPLRGTDDNVIDRSTQRQFMHTLTVTTCPETLSQRFITHRFCSLNKNI